MKSIIPFVYITLEQFKIADITTFFRTYSDIYFKHKNQL